jgi:hypothetical protein
MKKITVITKFTKMFLGLLILFSLFVLPTFSSNNNKKYGFGIIVGEPTGINFEIDVTKDKKTFNSIELALNFNTVNNFFYFHCDYLIKSVQLPKKDLTGNLPIFYGLGIKYETFGKHTTETVFGIRPIVGVEYVFYEIPFNIFAMLVPSIDISPEVNIYLSPAFGVRYYFK